MVTVGPGPKTQLATELRWLTHALYLLGAIDRLNLPKLHAAEHISRRILQIQRAARKNPRTPCFEGLEVFGRHLPGVSQPLRTSEFDKFATGAQKVDAFIMKQDRLIREESAAAQRQERNANGEPAPKRQRRPTPKAKAEP